MVAVAELLHRILLPEPHKSLLYEVTPRCEQVTLISNGTLPLLSAPRDFGHNPLSPGSCLPPRGFSRKNCELFCVPKGRIAEC